MQLANLTACEEPLTRALVLDLPVEPHAATAAATAKPTVTGQIEAWTRPRRQQPARRVRRDRRLGGITALVIRPRVVVATCMCTLCGAADNTAVTPRMAVVCRRGRNQRTRRRPGETAHRRMFGFDGERSPQDRDGGDRSARKPPPRPQRVAGAPTRSLRCSRRCRCGHAFATFPITRTKSTTRSHPCRAASTPGPPLRTRSARANSCLT
jgi:hypothetical protein